MDQVIQRIEDIRELTLQRNVMVGITGRQIYRCKPGQGYGPATQYRLGDGIVVSTQPRPRVKTGSSDFESLQRLIGEDIENTCIGRTGGRIHQFFPIDIRSFASGTVREPGIVVCITRNEIEIPREVTVDANLHAITCRFAAKGLDIGVGIGRGAIGQVGGLLSQIAIDDPVNTRVGRKLAVQKAVLCTYFILVDRRRRQ